MSQSANAKLLLDGLEKKDEIITLPLRTLGSLMISISCRVSPFFPGLHEPRHILGSGQRRVSGLQWAQERPFGHH